MKTINIVLLLVVFFAAGGELFASGSSAESQAAASGPTPIRIFMSTHGRTYDPALPNIQEIMKRTNTVLEVIQSDTPNARNLLFASNDLPDLIEFGGMEFQQYLSTGYILPLDDFLKSHGPNLLRSTSRDAWNLLTVQGKIYATPFENNRIKHYTYARTDWLSNLGIDLSGNAPYGEFGGRVITLNEYRDILIQFTRNDPDKNGKNDTYGIGGDGQKTNFGWSNIYGAYGGIPGHYYIYDGKAMPWIVTEQYRQGLMYLNSLWTEGVIDPEIFLNNRDQARQKMINSVAGSSVGEWWAVPHTLQVNGLQNLVPEADFTPFWLTSNDGKTFGSPDNGLLSNAWCITTSGKNPEKVMSFVDFFSSDEGWYLAFYGIPEQDYMMMDGRFPSRTELGLAKQNNKILDTLYPLGNRLDLMNLVAQRPLSEWGELVRQKWEILSLDNTQPSYTSAFYGLPNPAALNEYGVDVNNWIEQSAMAFITGEKPINDANWNEYINTWKRMGGVKILQGYVETYNSLRGTSITAGITE